MTIFWTKDMTKYIRQITEEGLISLGHTMNRISAIHTNEPETQRLLALIALDIERILMEEIITLSSDEQQLSIYNILPNSITDKELGRMIQVLNFNTIMTTTSNNNKEM